MKKIKRTKLLGVLLAGILAFSQAQTVLGMEAVAAAQRYANYLPVAENLAPTGGVGLKSFAVLVGSNPIKTLQIGSDILKIINPKSIEGKPQTRTSGAKILTSTILLILATKKIANILGIANTKNDSWKLWILKGIAFEVGARIATPLCYKTVEIAYNSGQKVLSEIAKGTGKAFHAVTNNRVVNNPLTRFPVNVCKKVGGFLGRFVPKWSCISSPKQKTNKAFITNPTSQHPFSQK